VGPWYVHAAVPVALVLATLLLYCGDLELGLFHLDDPTYILKNPWIRSITAENLKNILVESHYIEYAPTRNLSYMIDYVLSDGNPRAFHLSSNVWAGVCAGGVYLIALILLGRWTYAAAAAFLFVVHPSHVEAVAWISSRKDLVATAFTLPAMAAYFMYRRYPQRRMFYVASLVCFAGGLGGKLSVVLVPGILLLFDVFVERRRSWGLVLDKIPYGVLTLFFTLQTVKEPLERIPFTHLSDLGDILAQFAVLLTGLGDYVLSRPPLDPTTQDWTRAIYVFVLPVAVGLPLLFYKKLPRLVPPLVYWILAALAPPLVGGVLHPVNDRYLFFPSVAFVILVASVWKDVVRPSKQIAHATGILLLIVVSGIWARNTLAYLAEWQDPRSVWYAAKEKNNDVVVYQYLGIHFHDAADQLQTNLQGDEKSQAKAQRLAETLWNEDNRLEPLLEEWERGDSSSSLTKEFEAHLLELARKNFDDAVRLKGTRVLPNLYFRRGKLAADEGDLIAARREFRTAYEESQKHIWREVRHEVAVRCLQALGIVAWREKNYAEAAEWLQKAESKQAELGGNWVPEIRQQLQKLERIRDTR